MKVLLLTAALFHGCIFVFGQLSLREFRLYEARFKLIEGMQKYNGNIYELTDTVIHTIRHFLSNDELVQRNFDASQKVFVKNIRVIKVRRKGRVSKGIF